jgi:hypothetical protein
VVAAHWLPQETAEEVQARRSAGAPGGDAIGRAYEASTGGTSYSGDEGGGDYMSMTY